MKKRIMSMALCVMMLLSVLPLSAFTAGAEAGGAACVCTAACTEGAMNAECPVCSAEGATAEQCALHSHATDAAAQVAAQSAPVVTPAAAPQATAASAATAAPQATAASAATAAPAATATPAAAAAPAAADSTSAAANGNGAADSTVPSDGGAGADTGDAAGNNCPPSTDTPSTDAKDTPSTDTKDTPSTDTTETTDAPAVDEAVAAAQAQIDALATAEELAALMTAMDAAEDSGDEAAYTAAAEKFGAASDAYATARAAYDALTPAQQALIDPARLYSLGAYLDEIYGAETLVDTVTEDDAVAKAGSGADEKLYDSLSSAFENYKSDFQEKKEQNGIILLQNVTSEVTFSESASIILNLNGYSITNLTISITDTSDTAQLTIENKKTSGNTGNTNDIGTVSTLTVTSGTVAINSNVTVSSLSVSEGGTAKVSGGTVTITSAAGTIEYSAGKLTLPTSGKIGTFHFSNAGSTTDNIDMNLPSNVEIVTLNIDKGTVGISGGTVDAVDIAGGTLNISGGTVKKLEAQNGSTVNISGGTVGGYSTEDDNGLTVKGGTANITSGKIWQINLGTGKYENNKWNYDGNGTVTISPSVQQTTSPGATIDELKYYSGKLTFSEDNDSQFNKSKPVIGKLTVSNSGLTKVLSGGVFGSISPQLNVNVVNLLADGYAVCYKDGDTEKVVYANTTNLIPTGTDAPSAIYIAEHDCNTYNSYDQNTHRCACGRECKHTNVDSTGKCLCGTEFAAKVVKVAEGGTTTTSYIESEPTGDSYLAKLTTGEDELPTYYEGTDTNKKTALQTAFADASEKASSTLTLLADVSFVLTTLPETDDSGVTGGVSVDFTVDSGNFTLDLNGHSIGSNAESGNSNSVAIYDKATVTIKDSGSNGFIHTLYVADDSSGKTGGTVTIESGMFTNVYLNTGATLNFKGGTISDKLDTGYSSTTNVSGGSVGTLVVKGDEKDNTKAATVNVTGGKINTLSLGESGQNYPGILKVSNGTDGEGNAIIPEIGALTYYQAQEVELTGGKYTKIDVSATSGESGTTTGKTCNDLLGYGYAYYTSANGTGDAVNGAGDKLPADGATSATSTTSTTYYVCHHTCNPGDDNKCSCGRELVASLTTGAGESTEGGISGGTTNYYETLQSALDAAKDKTTADNATVKLLCDNPTLGKNDQQFVIQGGTFTLDLNGKSVDKPVCVISGNVTINGSGDTGTVRALSVGVKEGFTATVTIKNGKFNAISVDNKSNLTFNGGTVEKKANNGGVLIIQDGTATVNGGTINEIDVGNNISSISGNGTLIVENTAGTSPDVPYIKTLNYYKGSDTAPVTLKGGKYDSINGDPTSNTTYAKDVVDFLGDNCAYYTSAEGNNTIVNTVGKDGDQLKKLVATGAKDPTTYYVRSHECQYNDVDGSLYPRCGCGRVCYHDGKVSTDGKCGVCGKQLPIKDTDTENNTKFYVDFSQLNKDAEDKTEKGVLLKDHKYTLLADVRSSDHELKTNKADSGEGTIEIALNGNTFDPIDCSDGVTVDISGAGATIKLTGNGDLSKVTLDVSKGNKLDLSGWLGATDTNGLTIAKLIINGKDAVITLKDGLIFKIEYKAVSDPPLSGQGGETTGGDNGDPTPPAFTAGDLLKNSGFKLVKLDGTTETNVNYSDGIGVGDDGDKNVYKVVKCTHTEANDESKCPYCNQTIVAELTKQDETATTYYSSISDALDAAANEENSGCTIKLVANAEHSGAINTNATYTLDLNGKELKVNGAFNANGGNITLTDSAETEGELNCSSFKLNANNGDVFTIDGANVKFLDPNNKVFEIECGELVVKSGEIDGTVTVNGGKLTVTNSAITTGEGESATTTTLVPKIAKLVVSGGDVKLSGGKYGAVGVAKNSGKKLGDLLGDTADVKYGFKHVDNGTGTSKNNWSDSSWNISSIEVGNADTLTVEKLPIQSVTYSPKPDTEGKITCEYGKEPTLSIDSVKLADGTTITNPTNSENSQVSYTWEKKENGNWAKISATGTDYKYGIGNNGLGDRPHRCTVTVDNYSKTVDFNVYVTQNNVKDTSTIQPPKPQKDGGKYTYQPALTSGKYVGTGTPQGIMTTTGDELASKGCSYEFRVKDGDKWTEWKSSTDFKLTEVGEYQVYWRLNGNGLYTFNGSDTYEPDSYVEVEIVPLEITGVTVDGATKVYDGNTDLSTKKAGLTITLNYKKENPDGDPVGDSFTLAKDENSGTDGRDVVKLAFDNKDVGTNKTVTATLLKNFTLANNETKTTTDTGEITRREIVIKAKDNQVAVGQSAPDLSNPKQGEDYELDGLIKGETLPGTLTLKYLDGSTEVKVPDTSKVGKTYTIQPEFVPTGSPTTQSGIALLATTRSDAAGDIVAGNYLVRLQPGTLTVVENFTITATCDAGGTITPYGTIEVAPGKSQTFTVTPNPGYVVASVKVDGVNLGSISTYTFTNVDRNHTIHATFMLPWGNPQTGVDVG